MGLSKIKRYIKINKNLTPCDNNGREVFPFARGSFGRRNIGDGISRVLIKRLINDQNKRVISVKEKCKNPWKINNLCLNYKENL